MFFSNMNNMQAAKITPATREWSCLLLSDIVCSERITMHHAAKRMMGVHSAFLVPGDLDL